MNLVLFHVEQALYYNTGLIPSQYIEVMLDKDGSGFRQVLITSIIVIFSTSLVNCILCIWVEQSRMLSSPFDFLFYAFIEYSSRSATKSLDL